MGLSRRFQNLILDSPFPSAKWLRRVNMTRQLFGKTAQPPSTIEDGSELTAVKAPTSQTAVADLKMESIRFSSPIIRFHDPAVFQDPAALGDVYCFPLSSCKVVMADKTGHTFLCDADKHHVVAMPNLHKPKSWPISLFVPGDDKHSASSGSLYVMERYLKPERGHSGTLSDQFEVLVHNKLTRTSEGVWHCQRLPPPPFLHDPAYWSTHPQIVSYAVVGSHICISTDHKATYWLDTMNNTWKAAGEGPLGAFCGKVEYVPELKLWFGLSGKALHLAAADLSAMDSLPQLVGDCKEFEPPEGWWEYGDSRLVNLGSGRLCIARFYNKFLQDDDDMTLKIVVFTGVEVTHDGSRNGEVKLKMKTHKSRYHTSNGTNICDVF